jgi:intron-binding protein aquarius
MILLGLGDPTAASYNSNTIRSYARKTVGVSNPDAPLDFGDTFLDEGHLRDALSASRDSEVTITVDGRTNPLTAVDTGTNVRRNYKIRFVEGGGRTLIEAISYPFPPEFNGNPVRFTQPQVEAVRSGLSPGLTLVVGPPVS